MYISERVKNILGEGLSERGTARIDMRGLSKSLYSWVLAQKHEIEKELGHTVSMSDCAALLLESLKQIENEQTANDPLSRKEGNEG